MKQMYWFCILTLLSIVSHPVVASDTHESKRYNKIYDEFINLQADPARIAHVSNLTLVRDAGSFYFQEGLLCMCTPIDGKNRACVFIGKGIFTFTAPDAVERGQIQRTFETDTLRMVFKRLFLVVGDTTIDELKTLLHFTSGEITRAASSFVNSSLKYQGEKTGKNVDLCIMKTYLEGKNTGLFYAQFDDEKNDPLMFLIDPYDDEEVSLLRKAEIRGSYYERDIISQFPIGRRTAEMVRQKDWFKVEKYILNCNFADNFTLTASAEIVLNRQKKDHTWFSFLLYDKLSVDSVFSASNIPLTFFKGVDNPRLWIEYPPSLEHERKDTMKIYYHGEVTENKSALIFVKSSFGWCPRQYVGTSSRPKKQFFDITYKLPAPYSIISVGTCISKVKIENESITRWITKKPVRNFSFNIGKFQEYRIVEDNLPNITVLMTAYGKNPLLEDVASDIQNSVRFYQYVYGEFPCDSLNASDIPYWAGEAYPGMLDLSVKTFQYNDIDAGYEAAFRAHEVAHQWWGISVDFDSYRDQWLSEGFAEYSSFWYTRFRFNNNDKFFALLLRARKSIFQARKYLFSNGQKTGPISLGYRNESSVTHGDYSRIVYGKSAWVLHMIRNMMLDLKTMDEKPFKAMMKEFYTAYRGSQATTSDFKRMVEKYMSQDMTWFFDQWVYGTDLPTYSFHYTPKELSDGKYSVHCTVETNNVSESFKMPIPLLIDYGNDRCFRLRVMVQGKKCEFDLPVLPMEPKDIKFNDLESVLCEVD